MARIHVLTRKEELDGQRLPGKVVLVVDVLFATSAIAAALAHGAAEVVPTTDGKAARAEAARRPEGSYVLAGERDAETLPGFAHPLPLSLSAEVAGRALILSTTNGSVAIHNSASASRVYAASLLNGEAVVRHVERRLERETVLVVCAGSAGAFNLEDFYGAGHLVSLFARGRGGRHELSDAALAAQALHDRNDALECLSRSRIGRLMHDRGLEREVAFAAQKGRFDVVPLLRDGRMRAT